MKLNEDERAMLRLVYFIVLLVIVSTLSHWL